jgi:hypothetical protein
MNVLKDKYTHTHINIIYIKKRRKKKSSLTGKKKKRNSLECVYIKSKQRLQKEKRILTKEIIRDSQF